VRRAPAPLLLLVLLLLVAALGLTGCGGDEPEAEFPPTETGAVPPGGFEQDEVEIVLDEAAGSGISGRAVLSPTQEGLTDVAVEVEGDVEAGGEGLDATIQSGACGDPAAEVQHELDAFEGGRSETRVDRPLEALVGGEFAIAVRDEAGDLVACRQIDPTGAQIDE
jgi:hypothetical protein